MRSCICFSLEWSSSRADSESPLRVLVDFPVRLEETFAGGGGSSEPSSSVYMSSGLGPPKFAFFFMGAEGEGVF